MNGTALELLLRYQRRALETIRLYQVIVIEKSRRIGITWGVAPAAVLTSAASAEAGGMDTLYIGYNLDMAREFISTCGEWATSLGHAFEDEGEFLFEDGDRSIQAFRITLHSGYQIVALASRPRSLRGRQGFVIIDEAAFHDDLPELLKAAMALLIWGGKVLVVSTHDGAENPFNELVEEIRAGRKKYALLRITFQDAIDDGLYERVCLRTKKIPTPDGKIEWRQSIYDFYGEAASEELDVIPTAGTGVFLPRMLIEARAIPNVPVIRWEQPDDFKTAPEDVRYRTTQDFCEEQIKPHLSRLDVALTTVAGVDFARKGDLSVIWPAQIAVDLTRIPPFVIELRNIPFEVQKQIIFWLFDRLPRFRSAFFDSTGNGAYLAEVALQRYGARVQPIHITDVWYREVMPKFKAAFEDNRTRLPADAFIVDDHRAIKLKRGVPQIDRDESAKGKGEDANKGGGKRHGDAAIAHLMMWMASLATPTEVAFEVLETRSNWTGDQRQVGRSLFGGHRFDA